MSAKKDVLTVRKLNEFNRFEISEGNVPDGLAWDSAGHETHDGQGKGHEAADPGHHFSFDDAQLVETMRLRVGQNPSLDAIVDLRKRLRGN